MLLLKPPLFPDRIRFHLQVQFLAAVWMCTGHIFIQFYTQARLAGWNDVAVFPLNWLFEQLSIKTIPAIFMASIRPTTARLLTGI